MYNPTEKEWRHRRAQLKNKIAHLAAKERKGTITDAEKAILVSCRKQLGRLNGLKKKRPVKVIAPGPTTRQGPVRVTGIVAGGAPGLGKRG